VGKIGEGEGFGKVVFCNPINRNHKERKEHKEKTRYLNFSFVRFVAFVVKKSFIRRNDLEPPHQRHQPRAAGRQAHSLGRE
jgi:hypothetical protein